MRNPAELFTISETNQEAFSKTLGEKLSEGFEIQDSGMVMLSNIRVWWAIMVRYERVLNWPVR